MLKTLTMAHVNERIIPYIPIVILYVPWFSQNIMKDNWHHPNFLQTLSITTNVTIMSEPLKFKVTSIHECVIYKFE